MQQVRQVEIESIAAGGDGVARADGLVLFVPRTAPNDLATVRFTTKGRFARGAIQSLDRPSAQRVEPRCRHYVADACGGCQLQHLSYDSQLEQKRRIIADTLTRIGKRKTQPPEISRSPNEWEYRSKLTLAIRGSGSGRIAGLHRYDDPSRVFDLGECPITDPRIVAAWMQIKKVLELLTDDTALRAIVRATGDALSLVVIGGDTWPTLQEFAESVPVLAAIWWQPANGRRSLVIDRGGSDKPLAAFAQVNPAIANALRAAVLERTRAVNPAAVVDAYAGSGEIAIELAKLGVKVTAIELDPDAAKWSANNLPAGSKSISGRVEDCIGDHLPADVVLLNPPRVGIDERVAASLEKLDSKPKRIIYTSCNPATLARDLSRMPSYAIVSLHAFDMFPQTAHVETVCELEPVT
jgi:23S rRNA (uracil1939-C5)-methyltransferase